MDTNPGQYNNILKALGAAPQASEPATSTGGLSMAQQAENYDIFSKMMKEGVYLPDLIKRLDTMEAKVKALEAQPKHDTNAELLAVMEQAVKNDPEVKASRQKVSDVKSTIITEMCMQDQRYRDALEAYKTMVNKVYIQTRESNGGSERTSCQEIEAQDGEGIAEIRDDSEGGVQDKEGVS